MRALEAGDRERRLDDPMDGGTVAACGWPTVAACSWPSRSISGRDIMAMLHA